MNGNLYIPRIDLLDEGFRNEVQNVAGTCAQVIDHYANQGGLRGEIGQEFARTCSANNGQNQMFGDLVFLVSNSVIMAAQNNQGYNLANLIGACADSGVKMMTARFTLDDYRLRNRLGAEGQREAGGLTDIMNNEFGKINQYMSQLMGNQRSYGNQSGSGGFGTIQGRSQNQNEPMPNWGNNQPAQNRNNNGYGQQTSVRPQHAYLEAAAQRVTGQQNPGQNLPPNQPYQPNGPTGPSGPHGPAGPHAPDAPHTPYRGQSNRGGSDLDFNSTGTPDDWKPSKEQLAPPLALDGVVTRIIKSGPDGSSYTLISNNDEINTNMERTKHQATLPNQVLSSIRPQFLQGSKTLQETALRAVNSMAEAVRDFNTTDTHTEEALRRFEEYGMDTTLPASSSPDKAIMLAKYQYLREKSTREFYGICSASSELVEYVVCKENPAQLLTQFRQHDTFEGLSKAMRSVLMSRTENEDRIGLIASLDRLLTGHVNRMIEKNLMLKGVVLDSFIQDAMDLPTYILKNYGEVFLKALEHNEANILDEFWQFDAPAQIVITGDENQAVQESDPYVVEFKRDLMVFYIDVTSENLGLNVTGNECNQMVDSSTSGLVNLAAAVLGKENCATNYVVILTTKDDVQYEITKTLHRVQADQRYFISKMN